MSVAVKTRSTLRIEFKRTTPRKILHDMYRRYSRYIVNDDDDQLIEWKKTDLHKEIAKKLKPGDYVRHLRQATRWTLRELGEKIETSPQRVYDFETGRRAISKDAAKKLAAIFNVSPAVFI